MEVTITVVHAWGSTEADHAAMRDIYAGFQEENSDIRVQLIALPTRDELLRKVDDMIMVGNIPDIVAFGGLGQNHTYDFMVENDMTLDLMPYLEIDQELASDISTDNLNYWTTEQNQLFTVSDVLSLSGGYWYNEDILNQAGIYEIPKTWESFFDMCGQLLEWSNEQKMEVQPLRESGEGALYLMDHMLAEDTPGLRKAFHDRELAVPEEKFQKAMAYLRELKQFSGLESAEYTYLDETGLFNEEKIAIYINGVWGAQMISEDINAKYALFPTESGVSMACQSACLGYVLGNSGNKEKEEASIRFLKYIMSERIQERILKETGQIPANPKVTLDDFEGTRLEQAATLVLEAEKKIEVPDNLWTATQKEELTKGILYMMAGQMEEQEFWELLN